MPYFIYILFSPGSGIYYVGYTDNVIRRLNEHNNPIRTKFTSKHLPWELKVYFEVSEDRSIAMKVERYIKSQKSRKFIEKLVSENLEQEKLRQLFTPKK